jgi:hypothetical protein
VVDRGAAAPTTTTVATTTSTTSAPNPHDDDLAAALCGNHQIEPARSATTATRTRRRLHELLHDLRQQRHHAPGELRQHRGRPRAALSGRLPHRALPADGGRGAVRDDHGEPRRSRFDPFILDYPTGASRSAAAPARTFRPARSPTPQADVVPFDLEHAVTVVVSGGFPFETATITKSTSSGAPAQPLPAASDYKCIVTDASVDLQASPA